MRLEIRRLWISLTADALPLDPAAGRVTRHEGECAPLETRKPVRRFLPRGQADPGGPHIPSIQYALRFLQQPSLTEVEHFAYHGDQGFRSNIPKTLPVVRKAGYDQVRILCGGSSRSGSR
jgi:hypothetical protein